MRHSVSIGQCVCKNFGGRVSDDGCDMVED